ADDGLAFWAFFAGGTVGARQRRVGAAVYRHDMQVGGVDLLAAARPAAAFRFEQGDSRTIRRPDRRCGFGQAQAVEPDTACSTTAVPTNNHHAVAQAVAGRRPQVIAVEIECDV